MDKTGSVQVVAGAEATPLDFSSLRRQGIALVQRLAGDTWTDHNTHDPGITILEQLCYALTDLGYRTQFALPDLLTRAGEDAYGDLYTPAQILPSSPVTITDLRKLVIDVPGVKNVWIDFVDEAAATFDAARAEVSPLAGGTGTDAPAPSPNVSEIRIKGLLRVQIQKSDLTDRNDSAIRLEAARRLHRCRGLGMDFDEIEILDDHAVRLGATLEVGAVGDATVLLTSIYQSIADYFSPSVPFRSLAEMLERGRHVDEIFEGPLLEQGFIDPDELAKMERRSTVRISDLIRVLMAVPVPVPGIVAVKNLHFLVGGKPSKDWLLNIDPKLTARFDLDYSDIRLERRGLRVDEGIRDAAKKLYGSLAREGASSDRTTAQERDLRPPVGRDRGVANYPSVQEQFPMTYGIGAAGLPQSASPARKALAKQLMAYLMFYDQLLANQFAQLANVGKLFSFSDETPDSYFSQVVSDDGALGLDDIRVSSADAHRALLWRITEEPANVGKSDGKSGLHRRNRFLDHLLARFGEQFHDYALLQAGVKASDGITPDERLARDKRAFLRGYPRIGRDRGAAFNILEPADGDNLSGLELTLRGKLGINDDEERFYVVEHILLRPLPGDAYQSGPLLRGAQARDPYSLQISLVFPKWPVRYQDDNFRQFVEQTVHEETPAHLTAWVLWKEKDEMGACESAYRDWLRQWRSFRLAELGLQPMSTPEPSIALRSARDRVIDLLGIGDTYPLTDLNVVADPLKVTYGRTAKILIENAQAGVSYQLCDPKGDPLDGAFSGDGCDATLAIETPTIWEDVAYRILASKHLSQGSTLRAQTPRLLKATAPVKVGIDTGLTVEILDAPLLDTKLLNPKSSDPRIVPYGASVRVEVQKTQEGVQYSLVVDRKHLPDTMVAGDLKSVVLMTGPMTEDVVIQVRATKIFPVSAHRRDEVADLDTKLYLKVIANPVLTVSTDWPPIFDYAKDVAIRIGGSQASVHYRAYLRPIRDADFVRGDASGADLLTVPVAGQPVVQVPKPPPSAASWSTPDGYTPQGDGPVLGTGGDDFSLPVPSLTDDAIVIVQALKQHQVEAGNPDSAIIPSAVRLRDQAVVLLARPDPLRALTLRVPVIVAQSGDTMQVSNGQPGVFYHFAPLSAGEEFPLPAYFHQRDDQDATQNKGVGKLGLEIDFAVASDPEVQPAAGADRARLFPRPPRLDITPFATSTPLACRAVKAQTKVEVAMENVAQVPAVPAIRADQAVIDYGGKAKIVIPDSMPDDQYQLTLAGAAVKPALTGTANELSISTEALNADAIFEVVVTRPADPGLRVERVVAVPILVRPNTALAVSAEDDTVALDGSTRIVVRCTQLGVDYQLMVGQSVIGPSLPGNGASITLPTGTISADTTFTVAAARADNAQIVVALEVQATVDVEAGA